MLKRLTAILLIPAVLIVIVSTGFSKETPGASRGWPKHDIRVSGDRAFEDLKILASPEFEGRKSGFPGGVKTEDWVAGKFAEIGLEKVPGSEDYFQGLKITTTNQSGPSTLETIDKSEKTTFAYRKDYIVLSYSGTGDITAESVFVGYGINAPEAGHDDYKDINVTGKVVVCFRGKPENYPNETHRMIGYKSSTARDNGAVGFIMLEGEEPGSGTIQAKFMKTDLPALWVGANWGRDYFRRHGTTFEEIAKEIAGGGVASFESSVQIHVKATSVVLKDVPCRNVIGCIPGSDPSLAEEWVAVTAHHDHLGIDGEGKLYAGANDNASGTSVLLEIARTMIENGFKPRRTIVFCAFAAEEIGLFGAQHLAENPPFPLEKLVVLINMDMVGCGTGEAVDVGGLPAFPTINKLFDASIDPEFKKKMHIWGSSGGGSDQAEFYWRGIPALFVLSQGPHKFYHTPKDTPEIINLKSLQTTGQFVYDISALVAGHKFSLIEKDRYAGFLARRANYAVMRPYPATSAGSLSFARFAMFREYAKAINPRFIDFQLLHLDKTTTDDLLAGVEEIRTAIDKDKNISLVTNPSEAGAVIQGKRLGIVIRLVNVSGQPIKKTTLSALYRLGVRIYTPRKEDGMLKEDSVGQITEAEEIGYLLDFTGLSAAVVEQALQTVKAPALFSEPFIRPNGETVRLPPKTLSAIAAKGHSIVTADAKGFLDVSKAAPINRVILISGYKTGERAKGVVSEILPSIFEIAEKSKRFEPHDITELIFAQNFSRLIGARTVRKPEVKRPSGHPH